MIFAISNHIEQIVEGTKTQTRRSSGRYRLDKTYSVQPGRGKPGIPQGRILIKAVKKEMRPEKITAEDAQSEGSYTPDKYEQLYEEMHPGWTERYAYTFQFIPKEAPEI